MELDDLNILGDFTNLNEYKELEEKLRKRLSLEILHNIYFIRDGDYYNNFGDNAEKFDRDYQLWLKLSKSGNNLK